MDYCSVTEIANLWGLSPRMVAIHCAKGHVPHAKKFQGIWLIPKDTPRPEDGRKHKKSQTQILTKKSKKQKSKTAGEQKTAQLIKGIHHIFEPHSPYANPTEEQNSALNQLYRTEQSYLRGDFTQVLKDFQSATPGSAIKLWDCPLAIASAISLGDYATYQVIDSYLKHFEAPHQPLEIRKSAEYARATTAVSALAPTLVPSWLQEGDMSGLPALIRPAALYLRAKYYYMRGKYETSLAIAQTGLCLIGGQRGFTCPGLYFTIICAAAIASARIGCSFIIALPRKTSAICSAYGNTTSPNRSVGVYLTEPSPVSKRFPSVGSKISCWTFEKNSACPMKIGWKISSSKTWTKGRL